MLFDQDRFLEPLFGRMSLLHQKIKDYFIDRQGNPTPLDIELLSAGDREIVTEIVLNSLQEINNSLVGWGLPSLQSVMKWIRYVNNHDVHPDPKHIGTKGNLSNRVKPKFLKQLKSFHYILEGSICPPISEQERSELYDLVVDDNKRLRYIKKFKSIKQAYIKFRKKYNLIP